MIDVSRKNPPPQPRAPKLSIAEYEKLTVRARAHVDWLAEEDAKARQQWLDEQQRAARLQPARRS